MNEIQTDNPVAKNGSSAGVGSPAPNSTVAPAENSSNVQRRRKTRSAGIAALIEEAEVLKNALRSAFSRSHQLLRSIKRHRKQSQTVQTALRTLKELQSVER